MKILHRIGTVVLIIWGVNLLTLQIQPIVHSGSGNGGQTCADDDTDTDTDGEW